MAGRATAKPGNILSIPLAIGFALAATTPCKAENSSADISSEIISRVNQIEASDSVHDKGLLADDLVYWLSKAAPRSTFGDAAVDKMAELLDDPNVSISAAAGLGTMRSRAYRAAPKLMNLLQRTYQEDRCQITGLQNGFKINGKFESGPGRVNTISYAFFRITAHNPKKLSCINEVAP